MSDRQSRKEEARRILREAPKEIFLLVNIYTGEEMTDLLIGVGEKQRKQHIKKQVKKGWIPKDIFEENREEIVEWGHTRAIMNEKRAEVRDSKESITIND